MIFTDKEKYALSFQTEIKLELDKIKVLLEKLGNPQKNLEYIHVAGTNGKGSVCSFLEGMLIKSGKRTGKFSSPELIRKNETIRFNGADITDYDLKRLINKVSTVAQSMKNYPSPFEIMCAVAFLYFDEMNCEIVILETGMGGESDATNVIDSAKVCVLTHIALDHMAYLGDTLEKITKVKSGIIKQNSFVVTLEDNGEFSVIEEKCRYTNSKLCLCEKLNSSKFEACNEIINYKGFDIKLSLCGINQVENASLAIKTAEIMGIDFQSIKYGLENAQNPGRFEKISENIYFDGAHNPDGARALRKSIDRYMPDKRITFVMGVMADKEFAEMVQILNKGDCSFVFVTVQNNPRAMKNTDMLKIAEKLNIKAEISSNTNDVLIKKTNQVVFVCGSLYMYKDINKNLIKRNEYFD